jgi:hydroxypyruvate isomerase
MGPPMRLAVCAEMMFLDLPITERVRRIAEAGFDAEIWDWTRHDVEALAATGAMFSSMTGYIGELAERAGSRSAWRTSTPPSATRGSG